MPTFHTVKHTVWLLQLCEGFHARDINCDRNRHTVHTVYHMALWRETIFPVHDVLPVLAFIIIVCEVNRKVTVLFSLACRNNLMKHQLSFTVMTYALFVMQSLLQRWTSDFELAQKLVTCAGLWGRTWLDGIALVLGCLCFLYHKSDCLFCSHVRNRTSAKNQSCCVVKKRADLRM